MNRPTLRFLTLITLALAALGAHVRAAAGPLEDAEISNVRNVIVAQLSALALDDADKAFETATPEVRAAIGSSNRFLAMVRGAYPMVYRPALVNFLKPQEEDGSVLQLVEIKDGNDKSWLALFALERQPDQTWRISGCVVAENHWTAI
jgi:hypothetical protein